jgi:hypothetical protein
MLSRVDPHPFSQLSVKIGYAFRGFDKTVAVRVFADALEDEPHPFGDLLRVY